MESLLSQIKSCTICQSVLPYNPKPIIRASEYAKILVIGQAPGQKVQNSGIPWDDLSGKALREWLGVNSEQFYDTN
ncbi:MAG: uracil-DNA glycosylase family protein, partial [Chitinophagaceae bacterium]